MQKFKLIEKESLENPQFAKIGKLHFFFFNKALAKFNNTPTKLDNDKLSSDECQEKKHYGSRNSTMNSQNSAMSIQNLKMVS